MSSGSAGSIFRINQGRLEINWPCASRVLGNDRLAYQGEVADLLENLGILSRSREGHWEFIRADERFLGPRNNLARCYFTSLPQAAAYAREVLDRDNLSWSLVHHDRVLSRAQVLGKSAKS